MATEMNGEIKNTHWQRVVLLVAFLCLEFFLSACQHSRVKLISRSDFLTQSQVVDLTNQANDGDVQAAVKLSRYYFDAKPDMKQELKWLTMAAKNGDAGSQYNLGVLYSSKNDCTDLVNAKFWFEKAAGNGVAEAKGKLVEIQGMKP